MRTTRLSTAASRLCARRFSTASASEQVTRFSPISELYDPFKTKLSIERLQEASTPFVLDASTPITVAAHRLAQHRLTFAMVSDKSEGGVVGMLSEGDILRYVTEASEYGFFSGDVHADTPVSKWMTPRDKMPVVRLDDSLESALAMIQTRIWRHLPVLDYWGKLHSILDLRDVVVQLVGPEGEAVWRGKSASDVLASKRKFKMATAPGGERPDGWRGQLEQYLLAQAKVSAVDAGVSVEAAAKQMREHGLAYLVVLDGAGGKSLAERARHNRVVGLLTERSFLHYAAKTGAAAALPRLDSTTCEQTDDRRAMPQLGATGGAAAIMTPLEEVLHVSLTDPASKCISIFFSHNASHLPVIDHEHLSGIISLRDLLRPLLPKATGAA